MSPKARMLALPGQTLIATTCDDKAKQHVLTDAGAQILVLPEKQGGVDLLALMLELGRRDINEILVEAGSRLNGSLLQSRLIDEVIFYMAPILMGDSAKGLFELPGLGKMAQRKHLSIQDIRAIGSDWRISARPIYSELA
jgi:diaminohydroxyphosphoribosylaminopyrimidine deaminase/5-amino-6-(5-phosphoribosylamino)uracil reductase